MSLAIRLISLFHDFQELSVHNCFQVLKKSNQAMQLQLLDFSRERLLVNLLQIFTLNITGVFA